MVAVNGRKTSPGVIESAFFRQVSSLTLMYGVCELVVAGFAVTFVTSSVCC